MFLLPGINEVSAIINPAEISPDIALMSRLGQERSRIVMSYRFPYPVVQSLAARWPRLKQTQASWALLFCLDVSVPPSGEFK